MAECKDCIHFEVCAYERHDLPVCDSFVPAADVAPVIHAAYRANGIAYLCSHCHKSIVMEQCDDDCGMNYCPNCGAIMEAPDA